ncbi:imidazole glycerol phosphate synthase subunit HisH [Akkermansiaceae bacterium]|nr:imidazole glycerol phosphate synthase subunit HisH [Akkermansiaceae bacterium]
MISIVDYGVGNILAFQNTYKRLGIPAKIVRCKNDLKGAERLVLPGVGHFDYSMEQLNRSGMRERLDELVLCEKRPIIGICVGMQMMAKKSEEGTLDGLGWLDATVKKFDEETIEQQTKLPHMGWNEARLKNYHPLFKDLESAPLFYFLHSYYFSCTNSKDIISSTDYGIEFSSGVQSGNIFGIQFHPEKSHSNGEKLLENFAKI